MNSKINQHDLLPFLDLTELGDDLDAVLKLIDKAQPLDIACLCIAPAFVSIAKEKSMHRIATVINFPSGNEPIEDCIRQIDDVLTEGADEIDFVFPYQTYFKSPDKAFAFVDKLLLSIPQAITTKAIIESGALPSQEMINDISFNLCQKKIDFIKTSTGKIAKGADIDSVDTILQAIKNTSLGVKVSGGIRTVDDALQYLTMALETWPHETLTNKRFRIGASKLIDEII